MITFELFSLMTGLIGGAIGGVLIYAFAIRLLPGKQPGEDQIEAIGVKIEGAVNRILVALGHQPPTGP